MKDFDYCKDCAMKYRITRIRHIVPDRKSYTETVNIIVPDVDKYREEISTEGEKIAFTYDLI